MPKKTSTRNARQKNLVKLYNLLRDCAKAGRTITKDEWTNAVSHEPSTFDTYGRKQLVDFLIDRGDAYDVRREFCRYFNEDSFLEFVSQKEYGISKYNRVAYNALVKYEFLLPMTHQARLQDALETLFYTDGLWQRIWEKETEVKKVIPMVKGESLNGYIDRAANLISKLFKGYSLYHVAGRYVGGGLLTKAKAINEKYIIDEMTAVVRFLVPCQTERIDCDDFGFVPDRKKLSNDLLKEIRIIRRLFFLIFAEAVVESVRGEDQIWLLETADVERLYVWEKKPR